MRKPDLPIFEIERPLLDTLTTQKRLVITAPTGSGKSTQVPQMLLDGALLQGGQVTVLQPLRYHWNSASVRDFVDEPHTGIVGENQGTIMNLVDAQAKPAQTALLDIAHKKPETTLRAARHLRMPDHHDVRATNIDLKRLGAVLAVAYERDLRQFAELLLLESLGPRTLQSLALIAEVVHGAPSRFSDPARFSFAHGGKDRHPFPVPLKTYDESLTFLRTSLDAAKLDDGDKLDGFRRLEHFVRAVENQLKPEADFESAIAHENAISRSLDGRSVLDDRPRQLSLF